MAENYKVLTPGQRAAWNRGILRDAERVGIDPTLAQALCVPAGPLTVDMLRAKAEQLRQEKERRRGIHPFPQPMTMPIDQFRALANVTAPSGEEAAMLVAHHVREDLERRYPDAVNARCTHMAGERADTGILAVTWMRGREVFHRRIPVYAAMVRDYGARHTAGVALQSITHQIEATEGADRP